MSHWVAALYWSPSLPAPAAPAVQDTGSVRPAAGPGCRIPSSAPLSDKEQFGRPEGAPAGVEGRLQDLAGPGSSLHHLRRRAQSLHEPEQRRGARRLYRAILAAPQSQSRFARERVPRRALPAHRLRQRAIMPPASRAGRPTAATSTSPWARPTRSTPTPPAACIERPMEEGGGETSTFPFEIWHYRYLEGIGENIDIEFVDTCQCGDYHFTIDRSEKDALRQRARRRPDRSGKRWARPRRPTASRAALRTWAPVRCRRVAGVQGVRPHRAGRQDLRAAAGQVQGPGRLHLRAQAASTARSSRSMCAPTS